MIPPAPRAIAPSRPKVAGPTSPLTRRALLSGLAATLAACGLPQQGPRTPSILSAAEDNRFLLIDVDAPVTDTLGTPPRGGLGALGRTAAAAPSDSVGIGDTLDIRVLEAGPGGLFARGDGGTGSADFPGLTVDTQGRISLPYIGALVVTGKPPAQIEADIVTALSGKAIEPQALVRVVQSEANRVTVSGDVANPGPQPLALGGSRVSQAIAAAGGSRFPAHETGVTLVRGGNTTTARLSDILLLPSGDAPLQRGDMVVLTHEPPRYTLTGSVSRPGTFKFETPETTVLQALSTAGGPSDTRADAGGVFLFRMESPTRLASAGKTGLDTYPRSGAGIPTVYRFDLNRPETQFTASRFLLADGDALYVSSAGAVQLDKLLSIFNLGTSAARRAQQLAQ